MHSLEADFNKSISVNILEYWQHLFIMNFYLLQDFMTVLHTDLLNSSNSGVSFKARYQANWLAQCEDNFARLTIWFKIFLIKKFT